MFIALIPDFLIAGLTLLVIRRTPNAIRPVSRVPIIGIRRFLVRLPIVLVCIVLLYFSFKVEGDILLTSHLYTSFLMVFASDLIFTNILSVLEQGVGRIDNRRGGDPPNILEWCSSLYFSRVNGSSLAMYRHLIQLQLLSITIGNFMDGVNVFDMHRFYPTAFIGLLKTAHAVYYMLYPVEPYPFIFFMERLPEMLIFTLIAFSFVIYAVGAIISGI
jgi:hypothetical protein